MTKNFVELSSNVAEYCDTLAVYSLFAVLMFRLIALLCGLFLSVSATAGAWGAGSFENDDSLDWTSECVQGSGAKMVASTLTAAVKAKYLEAPAASAAVAAAEVVAAAKGWPNTKFPKELGTWLARQPKAEIASLAPLARQVLERVLDPESSELRQLWSGGDSTGWESSVAELAARLAS